MLTVIHKVLFLIPIIELKIKLTVMVHKMRAAHSYKL